MTAPNPTIPLTDVTQAGLTAQQRQTMAQLQAYQKAYRDYVNRAKFYNYEKGHLGEAAAKAKYGAGFDQFKANANLAKTKYSAADTKSKDYSAELTHLNQLSGTNPTLDTLLGKITPYDPQAAVDTMNASAQRDYGLQQLTQARQQLNEDYTTQLRQADQEQGSALRGLLSGFSGRGMAYSSGYGNAVGEQNRNYADFTGQLATQKQRGLAAASGAEAATQANYTNMIGQALVASTGRLAGSAGKLGLGSTDLPYYTELARRKLASNAASTLGG